MTYREKGNFDNAQKRVCPQCGHKSFVPYVGENGRIYEDYGRCDRASKCGYFTGPPPVQREINQFFSRRANPYRTPLVQQNPNNSKICYLPDSIVERFPHCEEKDGLFKFLLTRFDPLILEGVASARFGYLVGTTDDGKTIFYQVDYDQRVRSGKVIKYNSETGKRIKSTDHDVQWLHSWVRKELPEDWSLTQCLFGEHLLRQFPTNTVALVESEKTAIIGTIVQPEYVWLATGGKECLKGNKTALFKHLKGRTVIVIPDCDAVELWSAEMKVLARNVGFNFAVADFLLKEKRKTDDAGFDLADYILKK